MDTLTAVAAPAPSPWRTMWFSPRATTRRILDSEAKPSWTPVVALATFSSALSGVQLDETGAFSAWSYIPVAASAVLWIPIWLLMIGAGVAANDGEQHSTSSSCLYLC